MRRTAPAFRRRHQGGFTLLEVIVSLTLAVILMGAAYQLLDTTNRVSHSQIEQTDLQQSIRAAQTDMVQKLRAAGRGGIAAAFPNADLAAGSPIAVQNAHPGGNLIATDPASPAVVAGTDVLTVRGAFEKPIWYVDTRAAANCCTLDAAAGTGTVTIQNQTPIADDGTGGFPQDLSGLVEIVQTTPTGEAVVLVHGTYFAIYGVAEVVPGLSNVVVDGGGNVTQVTLAYRFTGGANALLMAALSDGGAFPATLPSVSSVAILDEYRYYIRDAAEGPRLSRARFLAGTNVAHPSGGLQEDVAGGIADLQVALGFDGALDGSADGRVVESADGANDDWLLNAANDVNPADPATLTLLTGTPNPALQLPPPQFVPRLYYVRISTLGRASRMDLRYQAPLLEEIEDRYYLSSPTNAPDERRFRREVLQTVIEPRNL